MKATSNFQSRKNFLLFFFRFFYIYFDRKKGWALVWKLVRDTFAALLIFFVYFQIHFLYLFAWSISIIKSLLSNCRCTLVRVQRNLANYSLSNTIINWKMVEEGKNFIQLICRKFPIRIINDLFLFMYHVWVVQVFIVNLPI